MADEWYDSRKDAVVDTVIAVAPIIAVAGVIGWLVKKFIIG